MLAVFAIFPTNRSEFGTTGVVLRVFLCALGYCVLVGCDPASERIPNDVAPVGTIDRLDGPIKPEQILAAGRRDGWPEAERLASEALIQSPGKMEILVASAEVKQHLGKSDEVASLLMEASVVDRFENEALVLRAVAGLMSNGHLFEAIDLLTKVVEVHHDRSETRRWLFDCLVNSEQIEYALPHGRRLIRERHFDSVLLFSMGQNEQRDREVQSLTVLSQRNPDDSRLKIGLARIALDRGDFATAGDLLQAILQQHPTFTPAWSLQAERLFLAGESDALKNWLDEVPLDVTQSSWKYWAIVGNLAMQNAQPSVAAHAYWKAIQRNDSVGKTHAKLARSLQLIEDEHDWITPELLSDLTLRAELLERLVQEKDRFYRSEMKSAEISTSIADLLAQLGRYWEAEAWLANAIRESNGDTERATRLRSQIVKKLRTDLPWQTDVSPFEVLASHAIASLPNPSMDSLINQNRASTRERGTFADDGERNSANIYRLVDESRELGLARSGNEPSVLENGVIPLHSQLGSGGASLDYDLDGWPDVFLAGTYETANDSDPDVSDSSFYRNESGKLRPVRLAAGLMNRGFAQGTVTGDLNEDGLVDLVQLNYGADQLFLNNGDGTFSESIDWLDGNDLAWSTSGAIADLDADGISDMVILRYCEPDGPVDQPCQFPDGSGKYCPPTHYSADIDQFFRGKPDGGFESATERWNTIPTNPGRGLGVIVGQLDATPSTDIFIANDMTSNHFWSRSSIDPSTFAESGTLCGLALDWRSRPQASMGIAAADLDGDHDLDFYVTNFEQEHNTLYLQQSPGIWSDQTHSADLYDATFDSLGFGAVAVDLDNDTSSEVMVCNGHVHHDSPVGYAQFPQLWRRSKAGFEFLPRQSLSPYFQREHVGRAVWKLDVDRDRNVDLIVTHQGEPPSLLCNRTEKASINRSLNLRLVGTTSARDAIGSVVTVTCGAFSRTHWLVAGDGYMSSSNKVLSFGLGAIDADESIELSITWPDGSTQSVQTQPDLDLLMIQSQSTPFVLSGNSDAPLVTRLTNESLDLDRAVGLNVHH